jgi:glycolate oxidase iron-sulfur subunit
VKSAFDAIDPPSMDGLRACVHCGICLPQCPTYRVLGQEMDSPRGRLYLMRAAAEGRTPLTPQLAHHLDLCLGCRACETACPSGVPFGQLLEATRGQLERAGVRAPGADRGTLRLMLALFPRPDRLRALLRGLRFYQRTGLQAAVRGLDLLAPFKRLRALESLLPALPAGAGDGLPEVTPARGTRRGRVGLLTGCVQSVFFPRVNAETARLLSAAGWDVVAPRAQGCCGALHLHAGRLTDFRALARSLVTAFPPEVDFVVTNAAGCGSALKEYGHWLPGVDVETFAAKVRDVTEVLVDAELTLEPLSTTVTYHDPCHLLHGQRVKAPPRALLRRIPGLRLVELADSDLCCGSAGIYNVQQPEMAGELARRKVERIRESGARTVVSGNPGCLLQIAQESRRQGFELEVLHPVELLGRAVRDGMGRPE